MVREQRGLPAAVVGGPKERHMRQGRSQFDPNAPMPEGFVARLAVPKSRHHTYFEFVENKNKKKKLETQITYKKDPPPGFAFVPIGIPSLTTACKEISREREAMIFIVSASKAGTANQIAGEVHRIGYHIRETIVDEAKASLEQFAQLPVVAANGKPEPIPESQAEYHAQADAALRDLFPRIPNTDRQAIIDHSFTRNVSSKGELPVGLSQDITLARRVQLAVLAHIRHMHTRYDQLLKETTWQNARKVVEPLCLDTLVQWRGDEETGRDQLDEILREVVVISDSETGDSEDESTDDTSAEEPDDLNAPGPSVVTRRRPRQPSDATMALQLPGSHVTAEDSSLGALGPSPPQKKPQKKNQRGFKRYRAWEEAIRRNRDREMEPYTAMDTDSRAYSTHAQQAPVYATAQNSYVDRPVFAGAAAPRPVTPPSPDTPIPSIEPMSPQTMPPSFVRSMPPRAPLEPQNEHRNQYPYHESAPVRTMPAMQMPGPNTQPGSGPVQYQPTYATEGHAAYEPRPVYNGHHASYVSPAEPWAAQAPNPARRIIMDVNRPGERSNPIVMEDRGGFYERITQPEDHRMTTEAPILVREVRPWSRPPEPYPPRHYVPRRRSPVAMQDHHMEGVEVYPVARDANHAVPQWRPQHLAEPQAFPVTSHRDSGSVFVRSVSQPASRVGNHGGFASPRRRVHQNPWAQDAHEQMQGHGMPPSPTQPSPRRHGLRGEIVYID